METAKPTFEVFEENRKFFVDSVDEDGKAKKRMIKLRKVCVVVSVPYGNGCDRVSFTKTNRGQNFNDSRGKKVTKMTDDGPVTLIRPLMISESEVKSELHRLIGDPSEASKAFIALNV